MNKRIRKKVEKRTGHPAQPHSVGASPRKKSASAQATTHYEVRSPAPKRKRRGARGLAQRLVQGVQSRAAGAVERVQSRAAGAVEQIKDTLSSTEQRAEALLNKVPAVGPAAAKKLHDLTQG